MGFSTEAVLVEVVGGDWGRPLWQARGRRGEIEREERERGKLVKPRIFMKTASVFSLAVVTHSSSAERRRRVKGRRRGPAHLSTDLEAIKNPNQRGRAETGLRMRPGLSNLESDM
ncbi:Hypothetical predicted protein [Xyrichtys novacula]|uniref:Uncharacterized protein n=1 Tax=Xyrichtys novacula TaxID=13765 RepID=A0AAV1EZ25_XYRNO|nr:Hypothetical predicted protein [Xyrichtys novacula]